MSGPHKDEGPAVRPTEPSALNQDLDAKIIDFAPTACKRGHCAGCLKPFTAVRKPRETLTPAFYPKGNHKTGIGAPVQVCGACRDRIARSGRPWSLGGLAELSEQLEQLVLAERSGALQ